MTGGSPTSREILKQLRKDILSQNTPGQPFTRKTMMAEEYPLAAYYYGRLFNHLHIPCKTLGAFLDDNERQELVDEFNEAGSDLAVLIIMIEVNAQGVTVSSIKQKLEHGYRSHQTCDVLVQANYSYTTKLIGRFVQNYRKTQNFDRSTSPLRLSS